MIHVKSANLTFKQYILTHLLITRETFQDNESKQNKKILFDDTDSDDVSTSNINKTSLLTEDDSDTDTSSSDGEITNSKDKGKVSFILYICMGILRYIFFVVWIGRYFINNTLDCFQKQIHGMTFYAPADRPCSILDFTTLFHSEVMPLFTLAGNGDIISLLSQNEIKKNS